MICCCPYSLCVRECLCMCVCAAVVRQLQLMGNIAYTPRPHLRKSLDSAQLCLAVIFCRCSNFSKYQMDWAEWVHVCVCIRIKGYWSAPHQVAWLQGGAGNHYASAWGRTFFLFSSALCLFCGDFLGELQDSMGKGRHGEASKLVLALLGKCICLLCVSRVCGKGVCVCVWGMLPANAFQFTHFSLCVLFLCSQACVHVYVRVCMSIWEFVWVCVQFSLLLLYL